MSLARTYPGWRGRCLLGQCGWGRLPGQCGTHRAARWMCTPGMVFGGYLVGMICGRSSLITLCARCKAGPPSSVRGACLMPRIAGPRAYVARSSALAAHACFSALYQSPSSVTVLPFVCSSTPGSSWGARAPMGTHIAVFQHDLVYIQRYSPSLPWTIIYIVDTWSFDVYQ